MRRPADPGEQPIAWSDRTDAVPAWVVVDGGYAKRAFLKPAIRAGFVVVARLRKDLADRSRPKQERQRALLFLVHFVSDIHQPLHVGDNRDHGGNDTQVQFFGQGTNLHRLWDSGLIHHIGGKQQRNLPQFRKFTPVRRRAFVAVAETHLRRRVHHHNFIGLVEEVLRHGLRHMLPGDAFDVFP